MEYGLQLYSVRDAMEVDFEGTLKALADMGYEYVEFAGYYGHTAEEIKVAKDVIKGKYGNGMTRRHNLMAAGFDYNRIQGLVNKILKGEVK